MKISSDITSLKTCFLSNYPPKECGIATFTRDLSNAMDKRFNPKLKSNVVALNSPEEHQEYPKKVIFEMNKENIEDYIEMAKKLNNNDEIKIISIQHEFGIFGGDYGGYLIPFLECLEKPAVITFHTVLPNPDEYRKKIVRAIASRVSAIVVIANSAIDILVNDYKIDREKIHMIHHGVPNVAFQDAKKYKEKLKLEDKIVLSTFGMLSRGKGIQYAIKAIPALIKKYPNLIYIIIGETHPGASSEDGVEYREELEELIKDLKLENNVKFVNKYLELKEVLDYLLATDIYLFTNLEKEQISSGTLAYALSCGKVIISTPIIYAEELLSDEKGVIVKFKNPESFTNAIEKILSNPVLKKNIQENAYFFSRQMTWSNVALSYLKIFNKVVRLRKETTEKFPEIKLEHIKKLTDNFGIIQFANHASPSKNSGYTLDDNSRALIFSSLHNQIFKSKDSFDLSNIYLDFIENARDENGNFKNQHKNNEEKTNPYSEDSFGRMIWGLGFAVNKSKNWKIIEKSKKLFECSFEKVSDLKSPRAKAFALIGLAHYYKEFKNKSLFVKIKEVANDLVTLYNNESSKSWKWFESYLTYANAKLPEALFLAYEITKDMRYLKIGKDSLKFLSDLCIINEKLNPIGEKGWYNRDDKRAFFDQQPIDASSMVQAFLTAYTITKNPDYYDKAVISFNWFLGHNHLNQMIYDEATGGCSDGLGKHSLNFNQGAESTVSYLISRIFLEEVKRMGD